LVLAAESGLRSRRVVDELDRYTIIERIVPVDDIGPQALWPSPSTLRGEEIVSESTASVATKA
jgi:hypothetical protein